MKIFCDYCGEKADLVTGEKIYPFRPDLHKLNFWYCDNGHPPAYVGCHGTTEKPLGRLADKDLRKAKSKAHKAFDPIWQSKTMKRNMAYSWLSKELGIKREYCHIGMFDIERCEKVVEICAEMIKE